MSAPQIAWFAGAFACGFAGGALFTLVLDADAAAVEHEEALPALHGASMLAVVAGQLVLDDGLAVGTAQLVGGGAGACEAGAMCYAPTLVALAALCFGCAAFVCPRLPAVHLGEPLLREAILGCM